jgi:hypothetical protein
MARPFILAQKLRTVSALLLSERGEQELGLGKAIDCAH